MPEKKQEAADIPVGFQEVSFEVWKPEPGERLHGLYVGESEIPAPGKPGETFTGHRIKRLSDQRGFTASGAHLDILFEAVKQGREIILQFVQEEKRAGAKNAMKRYRLFAKTESDNEPVNM